MTGQELTAARQVKAELGAFARELAERYGAVTASALPPGGSVPGPDGSAQGPTPLDVVRAPTLSLGLAPTQDGGYTVAVRYRLGLPAARAVVKRVAAEAGDGADVRRTGRIRTLPDVRPRPPVVSARALGQTGRTRPLRPGVSIAHVDVTAGTLGAFVVGGQGERFVLSNWHVLVGSAAAAAGDVVVQPGPADGGRAPSDRIGTLASWAPMDPREHRLVDAALALLDDGIGVDPTYPEVGSVTTTAQVLGGESVVKVGRTTSLTHGRVSAIEIDDVLVGYGDGVGVLTFDGQVEIESTGAGPFSRGGDSGALVYRQDGAAVGLLFAGSETGGPGGHGLTYVNPIDTVLSTLGVTLLPGG